MITTGLGYFAALLAINAFVFYIVKRYPKKIYKWVPPSLLYSCW